MGSSKSFFIGIDKHLFPEGKYCEIIPKPGIYLNLQEVAASKTPGYYCGHLCISYSNTCEAFSFKSFCIAGLSLYVAPDQCL